MKNFATPEEDDENNGLDEDGNPVTIDAATKMFHKNNNKLYCASYVYKTPAEAN